MNRRLFLSSLAAAIAAPAMELDPERALWVPGRKHISVPNVISVPNIVPTEWQYWAHADGVWTDVRIAIRFAVGTNLPPETVLRAITGNVCRQGLTGPGRPKESRPKGTNL